MRKNESVILDGLLGNDRATFGNLIEWYELGGRCSKCEREGWVDRWELRRWFGEACYIHQKEVLLRCMGCGNKGTNRWVVRKKGR